ncbi:receptor protein-tyrosine kinase CEPR1-like [Triticum dicoccoides]|uniref:receptor protein-tyrosine kinase CEPR1-like n=1 Tax=Triticum dicoccoides TaxID=85692 RepID=UPI00189121E7|nr:receptor protein-tyrosine kinase CEPR1-like [Triticum dicoccoides]
MPPNLRLCFAYFAFFKTERTVLKEDLIHQWIALDLIEPSKVFSATQLAEQYFGRLLDMSLLQPAKSSRTSAKDDMCVISFTMHTAVLAIAIRYAGDDICFLEEGNHSYHNAHCSYALVPDFNWGQLKSILPDQKIRALRCSGCSKMELHDDSFSFARCLRVLELRNSSMQKLPESICELRHLGYFKLSGWSGLVTLPDSIGNLTSLLHIELSACSELVNISGSFGKLINLVHINLSGCSKLGSLPESFRKLTKLVHIDLSGCSALVNLPEVFGKLTKLEHINLSGCRKLVNLPGSFVKLTNLVHINLQGCPALVNLPVSFGQLTNVLHINLSGCSGLVNLTDSFGDLTNLQQCNLSGCSGLDELPQSFGKLISLVHVNLSGCCGLVTLPDSFGDLKHLLHVDLSHCHGLSKLPESFGKLKQLVHLDLSFWSSFEVMRTALCGLISLQHLNLSHPCCYRADYPHLRGLKELLGQLISVRHLNLSMFLNLIFRNQSEVKNKKYLEFFRGLSRLEFLDLSHNIFLREIPGSICRLPLQTLDLSGCIRLKEVESWMEKLNSVVFSNVESYTFDVDGGNTTINSYGQLVGLMCEKLEIRNLDDMKSVAEARGIRLAERQNLWYLRLHWHVDCGRYVEDYDLLGELVPPHGLQSLGLIGYSSTCFPSWLSSSSISSFDLVEVVLDNIPNCSHLPPLGLLPNLQRVDLSCMDSITRIDAGELSGGNADAFHRLSKFTMSDMDNLEEFTTTYYVGAEELVFSAIDKFKVQRCPNLSFVPLPPRARRLVISDCNVVMICWQNRAGTHGVEGPSCISSPVTESLVFA